MLVFTVVLALSVPDSASGLWLLLAVMFVCSLESLAIRAAARAFGGEVAGCSIVEAFEVSFASTFVFGVFSVCVFAFATPLNLFYVQWGQKQFSGGYFVYWLAPTHSRRT